MRWIIPTKRKREKEKSEMVRGLFSQREKEKSEMVRGLFPQREKEKKRKREK